MVTLWKIPNTFPCYGKKGRTMCNMRNLHERDIARDALTDNPLRARVNLPQVCHSLHIHVTREGKVQIAFVQRLYKSE